MKVLNFLYVLIIVAIFFISCISSDRNRLILLQAESCIDNLPDSALALLDDIDYETITSQENQAVYALLYTQAKYKLEDIPETDSLIDFAISFFKSNGDDRRLAMSYYYKGAVNYDRGEYKTSMINLKEAEMLVDVSSDDDLANKIYQMLAYVNYASGNKDLSLKYSKYFFESSLRLKQQELIVHGMVMVSSSFSTLNQPDSSFTYLERVLKMPELSKLSDSLLKAGVWSNVSGMYLNKGDHVQAEFFARKADSIASTAHAKMLLGKIMKEKNCMDSAMFYWEEALKKTEDLKLKRQLCELLSECYAKANRHQDAYTVHALLDSLNKDVNTNNVTMQRLQADYDIHNLESQQVEKIIILCAIIICFLCGIVCFLFYYKYRVRQYNQRISVSSDMIEACIDKINVFEKKNEANTRKIRQLKYSDGVKQKEIEILNAKLTESPNCVKDELSRGREFYNKIINKARLVPYSDDDLVALIEFYKIVKCSEYCDWVKKYGNLTQKQILFLISEDAGLSDCEIADSLCIAETSVRSIRSRIKSKGK